MPTQKEWVSHIFNEVAKGYGSSRSAFFNIAGKHLTEQIPLKPHDHVLDIATGRGAILFPLAESVSSPGEIIGIDISEKMLKETSYEVDKQGLKQIKLMQMDAEKLEFEDHYFDAVFCGFGLFFFPSLPTALSEMKRVLKPGGKLAVSIWGKDSALKKHFMRTINQFVQQPSLAATPLSCPNKLKSVLHEAHFHDITIQEQTLTFVHESKESWWDSLWEHGTLAKLEKLSDKEKVIVKEELMKAVEPLAQPHGLEEQLHIIYATASA